MQHLTHCRTQSRDISYLPGYALSVRRPGPSSALRVACTRVPGASLLVDVCAQRGPDPVNGIACDPRNPRRWSVDRQQEMTIGDMHLIRRSQYCRPQREKTEEKKNWKDSKKVLEHSQLVSRLATSLGPSPVRVPSTSWTMR
jgi:hypothetical protein